MARTNLGRTSSKNFLRNGLIKLAYKFTKSVIETSSKVHKSITYNKVITNPIYRNKWRESMDKELWNLNIC